MNAPEYISIMEAAAIAEIPKFNLTYMDDNAPVHRASAVLAWKNAYGLDILEWPAYSPDMNPIENIWAYIKGKVNSLEQRPQNLNELHEVVCSIWNAIPLPLILTLYEGMPQRLLMCIKSRGFPIKY
jgi:hypothetical protein